MHIAVITEYNPFHKGHEYQLCELRKAFPNAVITAIMGGIFSQRGEPYITTPYVRARAAVQCGANIVLELPFPFSAAPASTFARAGAEIAAKAGADALAFGSECGNIDKLNLILSRLESPELLKLLEEEEYAAVGKTRAYAKAYERLYGEECTDKPNDILAIEYLRAIKNGEYSITPYTVKRIGDFKSGKGGFASATSLRKAFAEGLLNAICEDIPKKALEVYRTAFEKRLFGADIDKLSSAVLLKLFSAQNFDTAFSASGIINHLRAAAQKSKSISELRRNAATKRYTDAEISRGILYVLTGTTRDDMNSPVYYTRLLGADKTGCALLNQKHEIEIITKPSAIDKLTDKARLQYEKTFAAERAYSLCFDGNYNHMQQAPFILK